MVINVLNGSSILQLKLTEVLYLLEAGCTLVSISYLNKASFTTTFANGKCVIYNPDSTQVAEIPYNGASLYKLTKETDNEEHVNSIIKSLILDQIYHCLGYIVSAAALKLFHNRIVTSLQLESNGNDDYFCGFYIVGKSTQMPIMK